MTFGFANLPGWRWARIKQLALVGSSSSRHSEACKALGGPSGPSTAKFLTAACSVRAHALSNEVDKQRFECAPLKASSKQRFDFCF